MLRFGREDGVGVKTFPSQPGWKSWQPWMGLSQLLREAEKAHMAASANSLPFFDKALVTCAYTKWGMPTPVAHPFRD